MEPKPCSCCNSNKEAAGSYSEVIRQFERKSGNLIPALHAVQAQVGYLPEEAMCEVAAWLDVPVADVYGTATFYTLFATKPKGKYIVRLCDSPPCHITGSESIKEAITETLGIKPGETSEDGNFTFELVSCTGLCGVAPSAMINDDVYGNLTPQSMAEILGKYREKEA